MDIGSGKRVKSYSSRYQQV